MVGIIFLSILSYSLPDVIYTHRSEKQMRGDNKRGRKMWGKPAELPSIFNGVVLFYFYELEKPKNLCSPVFKY